MLRAFRKPHQQQVSGDWLPVLAAQARLGI
jgi:hypothetical protein